MRKESITGYYCVICNSELLISSCFYNLLSLNLKKMEKEISADEHTKSVTYKLICSQIPVNHEDYQYLLSVDPCGCSCGYTHCSVLC